MSCMSCTPPAARTVQVVPRDKAVVWEGWGTSLAWFGHALGHNPSTCETVCQLLFSKNHGLGLNIVRYNIGGANQDCYQEYRAGGAVPCPLRPDGTYDWGADAGQVAMLLRAAELGADTFEAFTNSPPYFWTVSGSSRGHQRPLSNNLKKEHVQDFAKFCADVVTHFQLTHGIPFHSLSPFNEPASPAWCLMANCTQEACFFTRRRAQKVLQALHEQPALQQTRLVVFEQFCVRDTLGDLRRLPKQLRPAVGRINTHTYSSREFFSKLRAAPIAPFQDNALARRRLRRLVDKWGDVPLWVSEFGSGRGALSLAVHIVEDLVTLLPSAWVYWQAVEGLGCNWGLLQMHMEHPNKPAGAAAVCDGAAAAGAAGSVEPAAATIAAAGAAAAAAGAPPATAAGTATAAAAGGEAVGNGATAAASNLGSAAATAAAAEAVLHPNYFVLQFLINAVPVGSHLHRVRGFGRYGFAVCRPVDGTSSGGHWCLVCVNPSSSDTQRFRVSASSFPAAHAAGPGRFDLQANGSASSTAAVQEDCDGAVNGQEGSSSTAVAQGPCSSAAVAATVDKVAVLLLDVSALQCISIQGGLSQTQLGGSWHSSSAQELHGSGVFEVEVPPGHLCRVDWL